MLIYRYEKEDGGGPWCHLDGSMRDNIKHISLLKDNYLSGCTSLESLNAYFDKHKEEVSINDCHLVIYDVPDECVIKTSQHVIFPKSYKKE